MGKREQWQTGQWPVASSFDLTDQFLISKLDDSGDDPTGTNKRVDTAIMIAFLAANGLGGGAGSSAVRVLVTAPAPPKINQLVNVVVAGMTTAKKINAWVSALVDGLANSGDLVDILRIRAVAQAGSIDFNMDFQTPWCGSISIDYVAFS